VAIDAMGVQLFHVVFCFRVRLGFSIKGARYDLGIGNTLGGETIEEVGVLTYTKFGNTAASPPRYNGTLHKILGRK